MTSALDWKYQRCWKPKKSPKRFEPYWNQDEVDIVLDKYRNKLYVFIAPADRDDRHMQDIISIRLVRLPQRGNISAKQQIIELMRHTVDEWPEHSGIMSRWRGNSEKIQEIIEGCIRRYRYTGSFFKYLHRTLQYAARGIAPLYSFSLDEPVASHADKRRIENVVQDPETGEIGMYGGSYFIPWL